MKLKNISSEPQFTQTVDGVVEVKAGEVFETNDGETLLFNYGYLFEKVEEKEETVVEKKATAKKEK